MIPLAWAAIPWRLVGAVSAVAIVAFAGWRVSAWHGAYEELPGVQDALEREEKCQDGSKCFERQRAAEARQVQVTKEVVDGYEKELADLRNRPVPTRVIRVCRPAARGNVRDASATPGADGAAAPGGLVHGEDEFDTRPLRDLAREADEVAARLRGLQKYNRALSEPAVVR